VLQNDARRGGEKGFFLPQATTQRAVGLQHAEAFAERFGEVRKKTSRRSGGEDVERFAGKRERLRAGFAEFNVGNAFLGARFFGKRNHARAEIGRGRGPMEQLPQQSKARDRRRRWRDRERACRAKMGGLENRLRCAMGERASGRAICARGDGPVSGPFLVKMLANF